MLPLRAKKSTQKLQIASWQLSIVPHLHSIIQLAPHEWDLRGLTLTSQDENVLARKWCLRYLLTINMIFVSNSKWIKLNRVYFNISGRKCSCQKMVPSISCQQIKPPMFLKKIKMIFVFNSFAGVKQLFLFLSISFNLAFICRSIFLLTCWTVSSRQRMNHLIRLHCKG